MDFNFTSIKKYICISKQNFNKQLCNNINIKKKQLKIPSSF